MVDVMRRLPGLRGGYDRSCCCLGLGCSPVVVIALQVDDEVRRQRERLGKGLRRREFILRIQMETLAL